MSMNRQWNNARNESHLQSFLEVTKYRGGIHGLSHAQRVERFGLMLAEKTDADRDVIIWFAYLHDSQRTNDGLDYNHGPEAAQFVNAIRNTYLQELNNTQIGQLKEACRLHTSTHRTGDITVDTCFDADRLDLPRVGVMPDPMRMATEQGAKYAGRGYNDSFRDKAVMDNTTDSPKQSKGLLFHDKIINTGKGESKFAVRFNDKTEDGKSIGPYTYSRGKLHYYEWNLSAKSVSDNECVRGLNVDEVTGGIYAVEFNTFLSGKGYAAKEMRKNENVTLILLEYTEDDVVMKTETEICFTQCNIVYVSDQPTFIDKSKDGTLNKLMKQFVSKKATAEYNTYVKSIRDISAGLEKFMWDFRISANVLKQGFMYASVINLVENLSMTRPVLFWSVAIRCSNLLKYFSFPTFMGIARFKYMGKLTNEETKMLVSLFSEDAEKDELTKERLKMINDAAILSNYLFTGKDESKSMFYKTSKTVLNNIIKPLRKMAEEQAQIIYNTKFKIST